jgi:hypothetical protein
MLKVLEKLNNPAKALILKRKELVRQEDVLYAGAFLSLAREKIINKINTNSINKGKKKKVIFIIIRTNVDNLR